MADDSTHPVVASNHLVFGMTAESGKFLFDAEAYLKTFTGLQEYIFISQYLKNSDFPDYFPGNNQKVPAPHQPSFFVTGRGKSYGIDLMLKYNSNKFTSWGIIFLWKEFTVLCEN